ncbi:DUF502 domain-containing protein [Anaeroselena agilis]|uniref:DUF502 domain-containing protein n=1 Tax=Anaeroselena agilis TaxID=3063788 RepID=A0ABU3NYS4_9FIRM|nr:DUF502 domain-containing protein [Selenomonadales bacterium 4137-cl]
MKNLSRYFINGLIVIVPMAITFFVVVQILDITERILGRHLPVKFPGFGLVAVIAIILVVGWLSSHWVMRRCIEVGEKALSKIPILKFIYNSVKQLSTAVFESQNMFKHAVLVPFPHPGAKTLGFVMTELSAPLARNLCEESVCVFIPMSLNMTAGFNIIVPKRDIIPLDVTSESALQYILTAGTVMPRGGVTKP